MIVYLCTFRDRINDLYTDFQKLSSEITLPCEVESAYSCIRELSPTISAITYHWKEEIKTGNPRILFNEDYFSEEYSERKFTLLHELIHACQRANDLSHLNSLWMDTLDHLENEKSQYEKWYDFKNAKNIEDNIPLINQLFAYIFEIWDELFLKFTYPELFEGRMNQLYNFVIKTNNFNRYHEHTKKKELVFMELIRANYLTNISEGTGSHNNFKTFYDSWLAKFESMIDNSEKTKWHEWLKKITDFSKYSDPSELEQNNIEFTRVLLQS